MDRSAGSENSLLGKPWEYEYDPKEDCFTCPHGGKLRHTTTDRDGKRTYRSDTKYCKSCPFKTKCGANEKGQKLLTTHIWQEYLDLVEQLRRTGRGKEIYAMRKETIERVFADAKEKHAMRYTHHRGLARVTSWVRLKYAAMNLKKLAEWSWNNSFFHLIASLFLLFMLKSPLSPNENRDFFDKLKAVVPGDESCFVDKNRNQSVTVGRRATWRARLIASVSRR